MKIIVALIILQIVTLTLAGAAKPLVINTWNFMDAGQKGNKIK